jgi:hypothetical protein
MTIDLSQATEVGENIKATIVTEGGKKLLVLIMETGKDIGPSSSGKMTGVASTGGFQRLPDGLTGNVYVGRKVGR